jgi:aryl-alcohol dehydrogenase
MKVEAAIIKSMKEPFEIGEVDLDDPRPDELIVRIVGVGLCHTDLHMRDHAEIPMPSVFGHEGAGIVEEVGEHVGNIEPGDHVVLSFNSCGGCNQCLKGNPSYCQNFQKMNISGARVDGSHTLSIDGSPVFGSFFNQSSFASYALASSNNAVKVPKDIPIEKLGPLGCGVQTGAGAVLNSLRPPPGSSITIFGVGSVGLSAIMAAVVAGCTTIIGVDIKPGRLELAQQFGATHVINSIEENTVEKIQAITGIGADFSLDMTGVPSVYRHAIESLNPTGVCGLVGVPKPGMEVTLEMNGLFWGRSTRGIVEGDSVPQIFIPQLIELYKQDRFPFDKLITYYPIEEINQAVQDSIDGITVKPVLTFNK